MSWVRINEPGDWAHRDGSLCPDGPGIETGVWTELPDGVFHCPHGVVVQDWRRPGAIQLEVQKPASA